MTSEEIKALQDLQGLGGFRVMQSLIKEKMTKLDSVSDVDENSTLVNIEAVFLGRKYAVKLLSEFLKEINLLPTAEKEKRNTYE